MAHPLETGRWHHRPARTLPEAPWFCTEALVFAKPERSYRVEEILFELVRNCCSELGCGRGSEIRCVANDQSGVSFTLRDGRRKFLGREYAWFVKVRPIPTAANATHPGAA